MQLTQYQNKMEDHQNIDRIRSELQEARQILHQTVAEVQRKIETVSHQLEPEHLVERHLLLAACIAGAVGFATGNRGGKTSVAALVVGGLLGVMLREAFGREFRNQPKERT